ncbi:MAG: M18 family aminopeptidase [Actinomycetaceae bacterium]|nr:M18 family aminopeptidase [Actinomycetaceae bacterium]
MTKPTRSQQQHCADLAQFISASPSSYHAAAEIRRRLNLSGFVYQNESEGLSGKPGQYFAIRDGAVIAWIIPESETPRGFRIVGSHNDSPALKLKPSGSHVTADGYGLIDVEIYGGMLLNSWLDREIGFAGRLIDHSGKEHLVETGPIARIPQLAIHLDREVTSEGLTLDKQRHMQPIWTHVEDEAPCIFEFLASRADIDTDAIAGHDIVSYPTEAPATFGASGEFFAASRQDNLSSVHASLVAFEKIAQTGLTGPDIAVFAAFDHEEVGSSTRSGAAGPFLENLLRRIALSIGDSEDTYYQMLAESSCISADAAHWVHPNYSERHDPRNHPVPGGGPILKLNANQRYATDGAGSALWNRACEKAGVPHQEFVSHNSVPCGSTIGPFIATRTGITTVDVGIGLLSMHSARELSHVADHTYLSTVLETYWEDA